MNILIGFSDLWYLDWNTVPDQTYLSALYVVLFATIGTYILNAIALRKVSSSSVGVYIYLQPVIVGLISWFWFDRFLSPVKTLYMLMVVAGVVIVSYRKNSN